MNKIYNEKIIYIYDIDVRFDSTISVVYFLSQNEQSYPALWPSPHADLSLDLHFIPLQHYFMQMNMQISSNNMQIRSTKKLKSLTYQKKGGQLKLKHSSINAWPFKFWDGVPMGHKFFHSLKCEIWPSRHVYRSVGRAVSHS